MMSERIAGWLAISLLLLVSDTASASLSDAQWGLDHIADSLKFVAAAIAFAGAAIGAGIYFGLRSNRRE
jgi:hypothetical protein